MSLAPQRSSVNDWAYSTSAQVLVDPTALLNPSASYSFVVENSSDYLHCMFGTARRSSVSRSVPACEKRRCLLGLLYSRVHVPTLGNPQVLKARRPCATDRPRRDRVRPQRTPATFGRIRISVSSLTHICRPIVPAFPNACFCEKRRPRYHS
jgi:hypothetical protein